MQIGIYISGNRLDLFDDEAINFIAKATELNDISKVFMDFTQSFTVPASKLNNFIFQHYYESDIDGTFNANIRVPAYIEIGTLPFRTGRIQLEGVNLKDKAPSFYKITFYSDLLDLSDAFGDDKLSDLGTIASITGTTNSNTELSKFDHPYTKETVRRGMNYPLWTVGSTRLGGEVMYPLISSQRVWRIGTGNAIDPGVEGQKMDITTNDGAINYYELKPGIRTINLIKAIEFKYGVKFSRDFFDRAVFQQMYMWLSNSAGPMKSYGDPVQITFENWTSDHSNVTTSSASNSVNVNNSVNETYRIMLDITPNGQSQKIPYKLILNYSIGGVAQEPIVSDELTGTQSVEYYIGKNTGQPYVFTYFIQATADFNFIKKNKVVRALPSGILFNVEGHQHPSQSATGFVRIINQLPEMKVIDFLGGIIKMFNLIIRPISGKEFLITTLDDYYSSGDIFEITKYVDIETIEVARPQLNKTIEFRFEKTENILGKNFRDTQGGSAEVGYGDLRAVYPIDGGDELKIQLPFENMLFERLTNNSAAAQGTDVSLLTNVMVGEAISITYSSNKVKPIFFYNNGLVDISDTSVVLSGGTAPSLLVNVYLIGNENNEINGQVSDTLNFGGEISPWNYPQIPRTPSNIKSLYGNYWNRYISNIYNLKQRKYTYNATLPINILNNLSLNDRLNVNDNQYRINDYTLNLTDGSCKLNLVNNFYDDPFLITNEGIDVTVYNTNGGETYFEIVIDSNTTWTTSKTALTGTDVSWVTLNKTSGTGKTRVTVKVSYNNDGSTAVTPLRQLRLRFTTNGHNYDCIISQNGVTL